MSNVPMTRPEEMLVMHEPDPTIASTMLELEGGRILSASGPMFATSDDQGMTWSEPFENRDTDGGLVQGNGLVHLSSGGIGMAGVLKGNENPNAYPYGPEKMDLHFVFWRSEDGGKTWEPPFPINPEGVRAVPYKDEMILTSSGRIVLPVYMGLGQSAGPMDALGEGGGAGKLLNGQWIRTSGHTFDPGFTCSFAYYSDDDGRTWQRNKDGNLIILLDWNAVYSFTNEPCVTEVEPGKLLMILRTGVGRLYQSWSYDGAETWTRPAPTSLAASTAPAQIRTLPNGHLLAVWTQQSAQELQQGYLRTRLSSAISRNGGSAWEFFQNIESIHEETRVEPGPLGRDGPAEYHFGPGKAAPERDVANVTPATEYGIFDYPSVLVLEDRVIVEYNYGRYVEHPTRAALILEGSERIKVLPLSWFYGGKEPADSPYLPRAGYRPTWG